MEKSSMKNQHLAAMLLIVISALICLQIADAQTGVCYGTLGNNLPTPQKAISLCNTHNIRRIRIYNPNPSILQALQAHPNISVVVGVPNEAIKSIATNPAVARSWVQNNIVNHRIVNFRYIYVGNEISPSDPASSTIAPFVAPAMQSVYNALSAFGLAHKIKVSTCLSMEVLGQSYPPSAGSFKPAYLGSFINPIVKFLVSTKAPILMNIYPYFVYSSEQKNVRLDYALFTSPSVVVTDGRYRYRTLFTAMVDSVHAALDKAGGANVEVVVAETGWPSAGGVAATIGNAVTYNKNLIWNVKIGTPRKPGKAIETYIFDLFDENQKSPELEKHWGVFHADSNLKYRIAFH